VADSDNRRVVRFAANGTQLTDLKASNSSWYDPVGLSMGQSGNIYVADHAGNSGGRIVELSPDGSQLSVLTIPNPSFSPMGVAVDVSGNVYAADQGNSQIVVFRTAPDALDFVDSGEDRNWIHQYLLWWNWLVLICACTGGIGLIFGIIVCVREYRFGFGKIKEGFYALNPLLQPTTDDKQDGEVMMEGL